MMQTSTNAWRPLGPLGTWKTGQRVPATGYWQDQYGSVSYFSASSTFPPAIGRKGQCAFRRSASP